MSLSIHVDMAGTCEHGDYIELGDVGVELQRHKDTLPRVRLWVETEDAEIEVLLGPEQAGELLEDLNTTIAEYNAQPGPGSGPGDDTAIQADALFESEGVLLNDLASLDPEHIAFDTLKGLVERARASRDATERLYAEIGAEEDDD